MTTAIAPPATTGLRSVVGAVVAPRTWRSTIHVLLDLPFGLVAGIPMIVLLSIAGSLAVTVVLAVPFLLLALVLARVIAGVERSRARALLDVDVPAPSLHLDGSFWRRQWQRVKHGPSWRHVLYACVLLPLGAIGFTVVLTAWSGSIPLALLPAYIGALPDETARFGLFELSAGSSWMASVAGAIGLLVVAPWVARGWGALDAALARGLLGGTTSAEMAARVDTLEFTRARAVDAAEAERRRIERDLHDGVQQRLVALAMDLGMARQKLETDPEAARVLLDEAHSQAKLAITEVRDVARGIHPVALTDRGLVAAIPALADRSAVPVEVQLDIPERPSPTVEGIAYFVVSECLTNVAKHAGATRAVVQAVRRNDRLHLVVSDDGGGGADPSRGSGLRGLADRVAAVDGTLRVTSPIGGPTTVVVDLPCHVGVAR